MNEKKSKLLRKLVYKDKKPEEKKYQVIGRDKLKKGRKVKSIQVINTAYAKETAKSIITKRAVYRHLKRITNKVMFKNLIGYVNANT